MKTPVRIDSALTTCRQHATAKVARHKLPVCAATGLARYRDRHQARQGARALSAGRHSDKVNSFPCPDCKGFHLEVTRASHMSATRTVQPHASAAERGKRRYVLCDIENLTNGAKASRDEVRQLWETLTRQEPRITPHDHVVVGSARGVARKYRPTLNDANITWVLGADAPDAADHALLAATDVRHLARHYDELLILSGDHAFADLARRARAAGLTVHVVTTQHPQQRLTLSRDLAAAANQHTQVVPIAPPGSFANTHGRNGHPPAKVA